MPEETQGYKLSQPKQSLAEYQQMGMDETTTFQQFDQFDRSSTNPSPNSFGITVPIFG